MNAKLLQVIIFLKQVIFFFVKKSYNKQEKYSLSSQTLLDYDVRGMSDVTQ